MENEVFGKDGRLHGHDDFDIVNDRYGTSCVKWDEDRKGVIPMWVADMDFTTAPCIVEALQKRVSQGIFGYTLVPPSYYDAVVSWFGKRHKWNIERDWILYTSGVVPALSAAIKALTHPGDNILLQTPVYNCFFSSVRNNGCKLLENELKLISGIREGTSLAPKDGLETEFTYAIDFEDFENKVKSASVFVLCNPHNPAGRVWTSEELKRMGDICLEYNVPVISDEIHCEIVMPGFHYTPMASISSEIAANTITLCSPSKAFNLAGLQIANIITSRADWRASVDKAININEVCDVNPFGVIALQTSYTDPASLEWLMRMNAYIYSNYLYLKEYFHARLPWLPIARLEGTYLVWCDCRSLDMTSAEIESFLLDKCQVHINAGAMYGTAGEGFIRINTATARTTLANGLERIAKGLDILHRGI